jgi:hypothetical protein
VPVLAGLVIIMFNQSVSIARGKLPYAVMLALKVQEIEKERKLTEVMALLTGPPGQMKEGKTTGTRIGSCRSAGSASTRPWSRTSPLGPLEHPPGPARGGRIVSSWRKCPWHLRCRAWPTTSNRTLIGELCDREPSEDGEVFGRYDNANIIFRAAECCSGVLRQRAAAECCG